MLSCGKSWPWIVTLYFLSLILFLIDSLLWLDFFVIFSLCDTNDFHAYYHASKIYKYTLPAMIKAIPGKEKHSNFELLAWSDWVALRNFLLNPLRYFFFEIDFEKLFQLIYSRMFGLKKKSHSLFQSIAARFLISGQN